VVYKARDLTLDRLVAIKVLPPDKVADPARKQRFVQEAKAASALNRPNIVIIYDIRSDAGTDFIVMEYIEGKPLGKGALREVLRCAIQMADALAAALPVLLAAGLFAGRAFRTSVRPEPLGAVPLTTFPGQELYPSLSPDGNYVVFSWNGPKQDNPDIYVHQFGSAGSPLRLTTDSRTDFSPAWSPDGRWIAFLRGETFRGGRSELRLIPPLGGPERKLAELQDVPPLPAQPRAVAWCPDSNCLVVTDVQAERKPYALFVMPSRSGRKGS
jgi:hypothetical protein